MVRPKPNITLMQRVKEQIFNTKLFEPLFKERPDFEQYIQEKIIPIEGDLVLKGLGIRAEDRQKLI